MVLNGILLKKLRLTLKSVCQFSRVALRFLATRSNVLDSSIPTSPVLISNTYQCKESHMVKRGVAGGGCWYGRKWMVGRVKIVR